VCSETAFLMHLENDDFLPGAVQFRMRISYSRGDARLLPDSGRKIASFVHDGSNAMFNTNHLSRYFLSYRSLIAEKVELRARAAGDASSRAATDATLCPI